MELVKVRHTVAPAAPARQENGRLRRCFKGRTFRIALRVVVFLAVFLAVFLLFPRQAS